MAVRSPVTPPPAPPASVLVVDDEPTIRDTLTEFLEQEGFAVVACGTGEEAVERAGRQRFDVALCDVHLPGLDGIEVMERLAAASAETAVVLITAYATVEAAVEAFQKGASDYLTKPILFDEVHGKIRRLLAQQAAARETRWLRRGLHRDPAAPAGMLTGQSPGMRDALRLARKVGPTPSTVLVLGESGTGKELMARAVHHFGQPAGAPASRFLAVNCAAIPSDLLESQLFGHRKGAFTGADRDAVGLFVHAGTGTLFLDEIGELPLGTQAKLLRAIEQKEVFPVGANEPVKVKARIVTATNKDLRAEAAAGRFRDDLFHRLNVVAINLPPLRDRRDDLPALTEFLLAKHTRALGKSVTGVSHDAMRLLLAYPWPGNVRELDNVLQRAVILGDGPLVTPADLPPNLAPCDTDPATVVALDEALAQFEAQHIARVLRGSRDKREAARRLGIGLSSLYRKIEQYGLVGDA